MKSDQVFKYYCTWVHTLISSLCVTHYLPPCSSFSSKLFLFILHFFSLFFSALLRNGTKWHMFQCIIIIFMITNKSKCEIITEWGKKYWLFQRRKLIFFFSFSNEQFCFDCLDEKIKNGVTLLTIGLWLSFNIRKIMPIKMNKIRTRRRRRRRRKVNWKLSYVFGNNKLNNNIGSGVSIFFLSLIPFISEIESMTYFSKIASNQTKNECWSSKGSRKYNRKKIRRNKNTHLTDENRKRKQCHATSPSASWLAECWEARLDRVRFFVFNSFRRTATK